MNEPNPGADEFEVNLENPWPGPESFSEAQAEFFRGRESETDEVLNLVHDSPLTILHGKSGLGKTSLLQAGLFPLLRREGFLPVYVRLRHREATTEYADEVRQALAAAATAAELTFNPPAGDETLWENFEPTRTRFVTPRGRSLTPVLVFDQFEELFTLGREGAQNQGRYQRFAADLANLVENQMPAAVVARERERRLAGIASAGPGDAEAAPSGGRRNCRVILSLRADFLDVLEHELVRSIPSLTRNRFSLMNMNGKQAHDAVIEVGGHLIEAGVATRIIRTVAARADGSMETETPLANLVVEPALLSIFCRELNETRKRNHSAKINAALVEGSREEILQGFYDRAFEKLPLASRERVRRFVEDSLVTGDGFRDNVSLSRATKEHHVDEEDIACLVKARLLRVEDAGVGRPKRVELTHDVLAGIAYRSLLRRQVAEREQKEREDAEQRERDAKQELLRAEKDARVAGERALKAEARREEAERLRVAAEAAHRKARLWAIAACLVAAFALWALRDARHQRSVALEEQKLAEAATKSAEAAKSADEELISEVQGAVGKNMVQHISQQSSLTSSDQLRIMEQVNAQILRHYRDEESELNPSDQNALQNYAKALEEHGAVLLAKHGHLKEAAVEYANAVKWRTELASRDAKAKIQQARELALSEDGLGDIYIIMGQLGDASAAYKNSWTIRKGFADRDKGSSGNAQWQCDLAISEDKIGSIFQVQHDFGRALESYNNALKIRTGLAARKLGDLKLQLNLQYFVGDEPADVAMNYFIAVSHQNLANVWKAWGHVFGNSPNNEASTASDEDAQALSRFQQLVDTDDPRQKNGQWIYDLAGMYGSIGSLYEDEGNLAEAQKKYDAAQVYRESLLVLDPTNSGWKEKLAIGDDHLGDVMKAKGSLSSTSTDKDNPHGALYFYEDALKRRKELAGNDSDRTDTATEESLADSFERIGSLMEIQGDLAGALKNYTDALAITEGLTVASARDGPIPAEGPAISSGNVADHVKVLTVNGGRPLTDRDNPVLWSSLAAALDDVGNVLAAQGKLSGALSSYNVALGIREQLEHLAAQKEAASDAKNGGRIDTALQSALAASYDNVGDTLRDQGDIKKALENYAVAQEKLKELLRHDRNTRWLNELALNWDSLGSVQVIRGDLNGALDSYKECIGLEKELVDAQGNNPQWLNEYALNLDHAGEIYARQAENASDAAARAGLQEKVSFLYDTALAIRETLAKQFAGQSQAFAQLQDNLAVAKSYEGDKFAAKEQLGDALKQYDEARKIADSLPPGNIQWLKDKSTIYDHTGDVYVKMAEGQGKTALDQARGFHESCIKIELDLVNIEPNNAEFLSNLAKSYSDLGDILGRLGDPGNIKAYQDSLRINEALLKIYPDNGQWKDDVASLNEKLAPRAN